MKPKLLLTSLLLSLATPAAFAIEQTLVDWGHTWKYFLTMSDDPTANDATIDDTGAGVAPNAGPDLIHTGFNTGASAWFAPEATFTGAGGYAAVFGKGFNIDGTKVGDILNYSSYDGGQGPGPLGFDPGGLVYFGTAGAEMLGFGTTLTQTPANRRFAGYFRTTFTAAQDYTSPRLRVLCDDNMVVYYDGVAIARVNRTTSTIAYNDVGSSDTTATLNETGASAGNENVIQAFPLDTTAAPTQADATVLVALPKITAGQHTIAVILRNSGNNSSDMCMGFQLRGNDAGLSAAVSNVVRTDGGTPNNVSDDTYSFNVVVTTINMPGAVSWTSNNPPANGPVTGLYGQPVGTYTFTYPAQANNGAPVNTNTITFADSTTPAVTTSITVTAPEAPNGAPLVLAPATPMFSTGFEEPAVTTVNHNRKTFHTELGFASNTGSGAVSAGGAVQPGGVFQDAIAEAGGNKCWRAVGGASTLTTEAIGLHSSVKGVKVTMKARSFTTSGTVFETIDSISLGVETSVDGTVWTPQGNVLPVLNGSPDSTALPLQDRIIVLLGDDAASTNTGTYVTLTRATVPVGTGAAFVRLRYTNAADLSGSENILLDDLKIEIATIDPYADADGDGATNVAEEEWGSGINDAGNRPGILLHSVAPGALPGELVQSIEFYTGSPFHSYTARVSNDLVTWTDTTFLGIDDAQVFQSTSAGPRQFFMLRSNY